MDMRPDGKYVIFWRAKCRMTGREMKFQSATAWWPGSFDVMKDWVDKTFRNLDLLEYRPWDSLSEDKGRVLFPVPVQNVKFKVKIPNLAQPEPRKLSLLISRPLGGRSLLKGAR
jgi:hypothetical protein